MLPAIRYVLGEIKPVRIVSLDEIREKKSECDVLCVNCGMPFYELELFFKVLSDSYDSASKPSLFCLSWLGVRASGEVQVDKITNHPSNGWFALSL